MAEPLVVVPRRDRPVGGCHLCVLKGARCDECAPSHQWGLDFMRGLF